MKAKVHSKSESHLYPVSFAVIPKWHENYAKEIYGQDKHQVDSSNTYIEDDETNDWTQPREHIAIGDSICSRGGKDYCSIDEVTKCHLKRKDKRHIL